MLFCQLSFFGKSPRADNTFQANPNQPLSGFRRYKSQSPAGFNNRAISGKELVKEQFTLLDSTAIMV